MNHRVDIEGPCFDKAITGTGYEEETGSLRARNNRDSSDSAIMRSYFPGDFFVNNADEVDLSIVCPSEIYIVIESENVVDVGFEIHRKCAINSLQIQHCAALAR